MYEMDKTRFGGFLAEQRKAKGFTQKDLAQRLFVSDKAVSKWERGISMPDISLLIPLADILEVSVTELLEGKRMEPAKDLNTEQVEDLVKKAITFSETVSEETKKPARRQVLLLGSCLTVVCLEIIILKLLGYTFSRLWEDGILTWAVLSMIFGVYFCLFVKEKLPTYYDENKIYVYSDGVFKMHIVGVHFNNSNWPYIVRIGRVWSLASAMLLPVFSLGIDLWLPQIGGTTGRLALLILYMGSLFIPLVIAAKKYE